MLFRSQQPAKKAAPVVSQTQVVKLASTADTLQYTLGAYLGQYIANNGFVISNPDLFIRGMNDAMGNKTMLVDANTIAKKMGEYQGKMNMERNLSLEKQLFAR